jgi:hypothetical protein
MTGGLLDLIAKGHEDIYLSDNPNITFFKMVYRRHTNFSKDELDLNFNSKLTFGKEGYCKISHYGDLVHRLVLSIKLPQIDIFYNQQTVQDIQTLLQSCGIIWQLPAGSSLTTKFDTSLNETAQRLINLKIVSLNTELSIIDSILNTLGTDGQFNAQIWKSNNTSTDPKQYLDDLILNYFQYDKYNVIYQIIIALIKDTANRELILNNSQQIQQNIFNDLFNNITSEDFDPFTYNDANIQFLYNTSITNYNIYNPTSSITLFNTSIDKTYSVLSNYNTYKSLDAYNIFNYTLTNTQATVTINSNIKAIENAIINNIFYGLQTNMILLKYTYNTINNTTNYSFYKKITNQGTTYNTNSLFINQSETITKNDLLNPIISLSTLSPTDTSYPQNLYNYYNDLIISTNKNFNNANTTVFRNNNFNQYFNDLSLWQRILENNIFFLNKIWLIMNEDIPNAINDYVANKLNSQIKSSLTSSLSTIQTTIYNIIQPKINNTTYQEIIANQQKFKSSSDLLMTAIFSPNVNNIVSQTQTIPDYIINSYTTLINTFKTTIDNEIIFNDIINIILSFMSTSIPTYSKTLNYKYANIQSSIINNIFSSVVNNYNNSYNQLLLSPNQFATNIGSEMLQTLTDISNLYLNYDITKTSTFDYFRNSELIKQEIPNINTYISDKLVSLQNQLSYFITNKQLLNMRSILVSKHQYFYQEYQIVLNYIIDIIKNNPSLYPYTTKDQPNDIVNLTYSKLSDTTDQYTNPKNNAIDIANKIQLILTTFLTQVENPFPPNSNLYNLWNTLIFNIDIVVESNNFDTLFSWIFDPNQLYAYYQQINFIYDNFMFENNVYTFMKDYVIQKSFLQDVPNLLSSDVNGTYLNILDYFVNKRKINRTNYDKIHGLNDNISLSETLNLAVTTETVRANFAWIKKIGHYIINNVSIKFDDQMITSLYGEWIEIWYSLTKDLNREKGYDKLIGNITELYTFDNRPKQAYELLIPIPFWFCKNTGVSLPLIGMNHSDVRVYVNLKQFEDVCYYDKFTKFKRPPKLMCKMIAEYIYVETSERDKLSKSKLQYQVDILQYNGDVTITKDSMPSNQILQSIIRFFGPCKELFWVLQDVSYINGSLPNGKREWDRYDYGTVNPIKQASIQFNGRDRELFKDSIVYNYIYPMERHMADPAVGVNIYSFSLDPVSVQSKGTANLSKIDDASISITLIPNAQNDLNNNKVIFRFAIYALSINMLRVCSGLAGLMYYA